MAEAYSNLSLIGDLYMSNFSCGGAGTRQRWHLRKPNVLFDAEMTLPIQVCYDKF